MAKLQEVFDTVRLPCYQPASYQGARFRDNTANDGGRKYWNCFPIGKNDPWLVAREGTSTAGGAGASVAIDGVLGAVNSNGAYNIAITQLNDVYVAAIYDSTNSKFWIVQYRVTAATCTKIGELVGATASDDVYLTELSVAGVPTLGVVYHTMGSTNSKAYYATSAAGVFTAASLTQIVDADFPTQLGTPDHITGPMIQLDNTTYVIGKSGAIYGSDLNSISSWNSLNKIQAIQYPDEGVALCRFKHYLVAFGEDSIEFFNDVGNASPVSPLQRLDQGFIKFGAITPRGIVNTNDVLYWLGRSTNGTMGLYKLDGNFSPVKVTTEDEDSVLSVSYSALTSSAHVLRLWPFSVGGTKHLMIGLSGTEVAMGIANGQTFTGDTNTLVSTDVQGAQLCMALDSQEFWYFRHSSDSLFFPMPAAQFQTTNQSSQIHYWPGAYTIVGSGSIAKVGRTVFGFTNIVDTNNQVGGDYDTVFTGTNRAYAIGFQLASEDFGNSKVKRVHQLTLNQRGFYNSSTTAKLWLLWSKNKITEANVSTTPVPNMGCNKIGLTIPVTNYRLYTNNLGQAREWTFAVIYKGFELPAFHDLELEISQGTS